MKLIHIFFALILIIAYSPRAVAGPWPKLKDVIIYDFAKKANTPLVFTNDQLTVLFVTASWCLSCQDINLKMIELQKKYKDSKIRFLSVYIQETKKDFSSILSKGLTTSETYLADIKFMKNFRNPTAPTIILFDHFGRATSLRSNLKDVDYLEPILLVSSLLDKEDHDAKKIKKTEALMLRPQDKK